MQSAKILNLFEKIDFNKKMKYQKFLYYLFIPITQAIEYYLYKKYWKIILTELNSAPDIVKWFDEQEFGFDGKKIYKKDIIEPDTFLEHFEFDELNIKIKGEFAKKITDLFHENLTIDIENYINMMVYTEYAEGARLKQYTVIIRYFRYQKLIDNIKWVITWFLVVLSSIFTMIYFQLI